MTPTPGEDGSTILEYAIVVLMVVVIGAAALGIARDRAPDIFNAVFDKVQELI